MQHGKTKKTLIVLLLTFVLLLQTTGAFAAGQPSYADSEKPPVEIETLRTENSKTYQLSDGSYQYVGFAEDIHYRNDSGSFVEINNALKENTTKDGYRYTNSSNSWHVSFSDDISRKDAVLVENSDKSVAFCLAGHNEKAVAQLATTFSGEKDDYYKEISEDDRAILYREVMPGVDIVYTALGGSLKEDIVLKSTESPRTFAFHFSATGVKPVQDEGRILLLDHAGKEVFRIEKAFMTDANGAYSDAVTMSFEEAENGFTLTLSADDSFLNAADTAFPVVIDPSVMVTGTSKTYDTCVDEQYPSSNYYTSQNLWTGGKNGTNTMRTYIRFDLPTYIPGDNVTSAYIRIKKNAHEVPTIKAYRVVTSWNPSEITWNNKPGFSTVNSSSVATLDTGAWYKLNVTTLVKNWMQATYVNHGFILKEPSETNTSQKTRFYSSDAPSPNKPELIVNYSDVRPLQTENIILLRNAAMSTALSTLQGYINTASSVFENAYRIRFNIIQSASISDLNPRSGCSWGNNQMCRYTTNTNTSCGANSNCRDLHHKSASHFLYVNSSNTYKVFRYVDYTLCYYQASPASHILVYGLTSYDDTNVIVTLQAANVQRTTCHELSHCYGARDSVCISSQPCVMTYGSNVYNVWCAQCQHDIIDYIDN